MLNLHSSLQPLSVGDAPTASLSDIKNLNISSGSSNPLGSIGSLASLAGGPTGAFISAGSNILGSVLGSFSQSKAQKKAYDYWLKMQEYNSPKNQLARLRDAGINPMFAMGNISPGNATSPADVVQPKTDYSQLGNISSDFINSKNIDIAQQNADTQRMLAMADIPLKKREGLKMDVEMDKLDAETMRLKAEERDILQNVDLTKEKVEYQRLFNEFYSIYGDDEMISKIQVDKANAKFADEQRKYVRSYANSARDSALAALRNANNQKELYKNLAKESKKRVESFHKQVDKWVAEKKLTEEQARLVKKQADYYEDYMLISALGAMANASSKFH